MNNHFANRGTPPQSITEHHSNSKNSIPSSYQLSQIDEQKNPNRVPVIKCLTIEGQFIKVYLSAEKELSVFLNDSTPIPIEGIPKDLRELKDPSKIKAYLQNASIKLNHSRNSGKCSGLIISQKLMGGGPKASKQRSLNNTALDTVFHSNLIHYDVFEVCRKIEKATDESIYEYINQLQRVKINNVQNPLNVALILLKSLSKENFLPEYMNAKIMLAKLSFNFLIAFYANNLDTEAPREKMMRLVDRIEDSNSCYELSRVLSIIKYSVAHFNRNETWNVKIGNLGIQVLKFLGNLNRVVPPTGENKAPDHTYLDLHSQLRECLMGRILTLMYIVQDNTRKEEGIRLLREMVKFDRDWETRGGIIEAAGYLGTDNSSLLDKEVLITEVIIPLMNSEHKILDSSLEILKKFKKNGFFPEIIDKILADNGEDPGDSMPTHRLSNSKLEDITLVMHHSSLINNLENRYQQLAKKHEKFETMMDGKVRSVESKLNTIELSKNMKDSQRKSEKALMDKQIFLNESNIMQVVHDKLKETEARCDEKINALSAMYQQQIDEMNCKLREAKNKELLLQETIIHIKHGFDDIDKKIEHIAEQYFAVLNQRIESYQVDIQTKICDEMLRSIKNKVLNEYDPLLNNLLNGQRECQEKILELQANNHKSKEELRIENQIQYFREAIANAKDLEMLRSLIDEVKRESMSAEYSQGKEIVSQVLIPLLDQNTAEIACELNKIVKNALVTLKKNGFATEIIPEFSSTPRKPIKSMPVPFKGRDKEKTQLIEWIENGVSKIAIIGKEGIGKSGLVAKHIESFTKDVYLHDFREDPSILNAINNIITAYESLSVDPISQLQAILSSQPVILIFDSVESIQDSCEFPCLNDLIEILDHSQLIVTARNLDRSTQRLFGDKILELEEINSEQAQMLLLEITGHKIDPEKIESIYHLLNGHLMNIVTAGNSLSIKMIKAHDPSNIDSDFERYVRWLSSLRGNVSYFDLFAELLDLLSNDERDLIVLIATLAHAPVRKEFFVHEDNKNIASIIDSLEKYKLLVRTDEEWQISSRALYEHIGEYLSPKKQILDSFVSHFSSILGKDLLRHALALEENLEKYQLEYPCFLEVMKQINE